jgi:hypothetical protein
MKKPNHPLRQMNVLWRLQRLTNEVERLVPDVRAALAEPEEHRSLLASAASALHRATGAVRTLVDQSAGPKAGSELSAFLEGTSPLMSLLGSRVVLASAGRQPAPPPSIGARALARLLEEPERAFEAPEIAKHLDCDVPVARTTLNRLVKSGHATRPTAGRFRARRA